MRSQLRPGHSLVDTLKSPVETQTSAVHPGVHVELLPLSCLALLEGGGSLGEAPPSTLSSKTDLGDVL